MTSKISLGSMVCVVGAGAFLSAGCGSSSTSKAFDFAAVAPIVEKAAPAALKSSTTARVQSKFRQAYASVLSHFYPADAHAAVAADSDAATFIKNMFTGSYAKISGGQGVGFINSYLEDLDSRMNDLETRFTTLPACLSSTASSYRINLSSINPVADLTLKSNCFDKFGGPGELAKTGSGMVFGKDGTTSSILLLLLHETTAGFGYAANVSNQGTDDEQVDMIFGQFNTGVTTLTPSTSDSPLLVRLRAKSVAKTFELAVAGAYAGSTSAITGGSAQIACGLQMISNGTLVYAKGRRTNGGASSCDTASLVDFEVCLSGTDFSAAGNTECDTLKTQFTIGTNANLDAFKNTETSTVHDLFTTANIAKIAEQISVTRAGTETVATSIRSK